MANIGEGRAPCRHPGYHGDRPQGRSLRVGDSAAASAGNRLRALGPAAFEGGWPAAGLGLIIHFTIAGVWAAIFAFATTRLAALSRVRSIGAISAVGLGYGALVWLAMDFVVLANSRACPVPVTSPAFWLQLAIHMVCVGLPIAMTVLKRS